MKEKADAIKAKVDKMVDEPSYLFNQEFESSFMRHLNKDNASKLRGSKKKESMYQTTKSSMPNKINRSDLKSGLSFIPEQEIISNYHMRSSNHSNNLYIRES